VLTPWHLAPRERELASPSQAAAGQ
jgi:hypothetical protein